MIAGGSVRRAMSATVRVSPKARLPLLILCGMLCGVVLLGGLIVSAEAGQVVARYLGLAAILLASTGLVGGFVTLERFSGSLPQECDE